MYLFVISYSAGLGSSPVRCSSCFQFLGLDFMVSVDWRVWLIESNNYPLWPRGTPEINRMIEELGVSEEF